MMSRLFSTFCLLLLTPCFGGGEEENHISQGDHAVANLMGPPSAVVAGCVNVITGDFFIHEIDMVIPGVEPLAFERSYSSSDKEESGPLAYAWHLNHYGEVRSINKTVYAEVKGENGAKSLFQQQWGGSYRLSNRMLNQGACNIVNGEISGRHAPLNDRLTSFGWKGPTLIDGAGNKKVFNVLKATLFNVLKNTLSPTQRYFLRKQIKKAGFTYSYEYQKKTHTISKVSLFNNSNQSIAHLNVDRPQSFQNIKPQIKVSASDGREVVYHLLDGFDLGLSSKKKKKLFPLVKRKRRQFHLTKVTSACKPETTYQYGAYYPFKSRKIDPSKQQLRITKESRPDNRYRKIDYYMANSTTRPAGVTMGKISDAAPNRVATLSAPVGTTAEPIVTHQFLYRLGPLGNFGTTIVFNAYKQQTNYLFQRKRLTEIQHYRGYGVNYLDSKELFHWNHQNELVSKVIQNEHGWNQLCQHNTYDSHGNITVQRLWGNLTGNNKDHLFIDKDGAPKETGCENSSIRYTYTRNHQVDRERDDQKSIKYVYDQKDLLTAKYLISSDRIIRKRFFYQYDRNACLVKEIVDDGNSAHCSNLAGVTQRLTTTITPTDSAPFGLDAVVEKWYWDCDLSVDRKLEKIVNHYNAAGKLVRQEHYDSEDIYRYQLIWEYDAHGNVTKEVDPFGHIVTKEYDRNDNLIAVKGPRPGQAKYYSYDYSNRMISETAQLPSGEQLVKHYHYSYTNLLIKESDFCGNETQYSYDHMQRRTSSEYPPVQRCENSSICYNERTSYDVLGNPCNKYDRNGELTSTLFTIRGAPHTITYSNGTQERIVYSLRGVVKEKHETNGNVTHYQNDWADRPTHCALFDSDHNLLATTTKEYNAFHLIAETDSGGVTTRYSYDGAGRVVEMSRGQERSRYSYNSIGLIATQTAHDIDGSILLTKAFEYDLIGRLAAERTYDGSGQLQRDLSYLYDCDGNRTHTIAQTGSATRISVTEYDCFQRPTKKIDADGHTTFIHYRYDHINALGQRTPTIEEIDPHGISTLTIKDAMGRDAEKLKRNAFGETLSHSHYYYDGNGNLTCRIDERIAGTTLLDQQKTLWEYNHHNQPTLQVQGAGSAKPHATIWEYDRHGRKIAEKKGNGTTLHYSYDAKGHLCRMYASDASIDYIYSYNAHEQITAVEDCIHKSITHRHYDSSGRMVCEEQSNGLSLSYRHDPLGRDIAITLPDGSSIERSYCGALFSTITKRDRQGDPLYEHRYDHYTLDGQLTQATLVGQAGILTIDRDLQGRPTAITHPHWQEVISGYDSVGNLMGKEIHDSRGSAPTHYSYNASYQLTEELEQQSCRTHSYDSLDNRLTRNETRYHYNALNQITDSDDGNRYHYDDSGNLTSRCDCRGQTTHYRYDALDRLIAVVTETDEVHYTYDAFHRRQSKESYRSGATPQFQQRSRYLYQHQNEIATVDDEGILTELRILGDGLGAEIGAAIAIEVEGTLYAPIHDHNGNLAALIDASNGQIVRSFRYSAYGEIILFDGQGAVRPLDKTLTPWTFSSKRYDPESGFYNFGRRYYTPALARWITTDPQGYDDGPNLYAYLHSNPLTHFDLYGLTGERTYHTHTQVRWYVVAPPNTRRAPQAGRPIHYRWDRSGSELTLYPRNSNRPFYFSYSEQGGRRVWLKTEYVRTGVVGNKRYQNQAVLNISGICTDPETCRSWAQAISRQLDGARVRWICDPTVNPGWDLIKAVIEKSPILTKASKEIAMVVKHEYTHLRQTTPQPIISVMAHSRGGLQLDRATGILCRHIRAAMRVTTIGSASIMRDKGFGVIDCIMSIMLTSFPRQTF